MFTVRDLVQPESIDEAYKVLAGKRSNTVLGGCAYLRMGSKKIGTAVDLSKLHLNDIKEQDGSIEIGAMATFRDMETHSLLNKHFTAIIPKALRNIVGIQFRNVVTVGASVFSRYGFSDLLTALLALDTEVELYQGGRMTLEEFMIKPFENDILTKVFIKLNDRNAAYQSFRNSASDYPILNAAVSQLNGQWRIVVGARPLKAQIAHKASLALTDLNSEGLTPSNIAKVAEMAAEELTFGTNTRGSAEYRKAMCKVLVQRGITEVLSCE